MPLMHCVHWYSEERNVLSDRPKTATVCDGSRKFLGSEFQIDECRMAQAAADPQTKPNDLGCESAYSLHPLSPFIIITQPES